jgi:hypothetical protein
MSQEGPGLTAEERELLEAFAPYLHYDAQDGYRAVSAATMTDAPCNCLTRRDGALIAGKGSFADLSLGVLADYPGSLSFQEGDQMASAPNPLEDAVKMQRQLVEYPHCAYGRAVPRGADLWLEYWLWYYDNPKTFLGTGRHEGDWEMVIVELDEAHQPKSVTCSQHTAGEARRWDRVTKIDGHPLVYVAPFSHANYFQPGTRFFFPGADHPTDKGPPPVIPAIAEFGEWQTWRGRWGSSRGVFMRSRLLAPLVKGRLGGESPAAPVAQEQRWSRPESYHGAAVRRKPIGWFKAALWQIGKLNFPLDPTIDEATTLAGTKLAVKYELPVNGLHRSRHLLLTVHTADDREDMVLSRVVRNAPSAGEEVLELPESGGLPSVTDGCVVYGSAFNLLGQRSDPVRHPVQAST